MFKKDSIDILDLPELHRKKLISLPGQSETEKTQITKDGFFDLSSQKEKTEQGNENNQETDFLSSFASIGSAQQSEVKQENKSDNINDLKWRIENLEYKLEQLIEKLNSKDTAI
ncbi:MAG: hypothetical protein AABW89_06115 [Nanoarchaeota archaeon]